MRLGVIQPSFVPWRGYFDFIASVDLFVFYDDVQYTKNDWRNRNRIKTAEGARWVSVPVHHDRLKKRICDTLVFEAHDWRTDHRRLWDAHYRHAPFVSDVFALLGDMMRGQEGLTISELDINLTRSICGYLGITTPTLKSSDLGLAGARTERLLDLLEKVGATCYLSGPGADAYLDKTLFRSRGVRLEYKSYDYDVYPQQWVGFENHLSVLDLIANCGPDSRAFIRSRTPDVAVVAGGLA